MPAAKPNKSADRLWDRTVKPVGLACIASRAIHINVGIKENNRHVRRLHSAKGILTAKI
jgi:hypothetical protein